MRVWIVITYDPVPGVDRNARIYRYGCLAEELLRSGHHVVFWTSTFDHSRKVQRFTESKSIAVAPAFTARFLYAPGYSCNISLARILHNRQIAASFARYAQEAQAPDLIFAGIPCLEVAEQAVFYGNERGVPVIVDIQDIWPEVYLCATPRLLQPIARLLLRSEYARFRRICCGAMGLTAVSRTYLEWALANSGRRENPTDGVFPLGCQDVFRSRSENDLLLANFREKYGLNSSCVNVVYLGQFAASYDLTTVVECARLLRRLNHDRTRFILAGDGSKARALRRKAQGLENLIFTGWLDREEIETLLMAGSVGLAPYVSGAKQSLPYKPFEYMAAGLPLVSSLQGELEGLIRQHSIGVQYQAGDALSLKEALLDLLSNDSARRDMGLRARRLFANQFDTEIIYPRLVRHLEDVLPLSPPNKNLSKLHHGSPRAEAIRSTPPLINGH